MPMPAKKSGSSYVKNAGVCARSGLHREKKIRMRGYLSSASACICAHLVSAVKSTLGDGDDDQEEAKRAVSDMDKFDRDHQLDEDDD